MNNESRKVIYPPDSPEYYKDWGFSPAVSSGGFVFVSGCTGTNPDGDVPNGIAAQTRKAFKRIKLSLQEEGLDFCDIVEMTTYHVELNAHLQEFIAAKAEFISESFPAWTAIGVSELAAENALVEIKVTARSKRTS